MCRPFHSLLKFWTPRQSTCGVRYARLSCFGRHLPDYMASVPAALHNLDASQLGRWRPSYAFIAIWTPNTLTTGVHSAHLLQSGCHTHNHTASNFVDLLKLDATHSITRRPFCSASPIWTPHTQSHGVQFCCSSQVGRHPLNHTASVLLSFPDLDAIRTITRRPILLLFSSWTSLNSDAGVHSAQLPRFGRLTLNHTASNFVDLLKLDATKLGRRRPFCTPISIWTPYAQSHGVQFCCPSQVGRHPLNHTASVLLSLSNLDATHSITWRPFCTPIMFWTPCNIWTPCHIRIHPPISPEFRKIKQATAWLSIILESGQLPSSL